MARTPTGQFPIGFVCNGYGSTWQQDLPAVIAFCLEEGFESFDGIIQSELMATVYESARTGRSVRIAHTSR